MTQRFVYLIGSTDDLATVEDLVAAYQSGDGDLSAFNAGAYHVETILVPGRPPKQAKETALMMGMGLAFRDGWCIDGTVGELLGPFPADEEDESDEVLLPRRRRA